MRWWSWMALVTVTALGAPSAAAQCPANQGFGPLAPSDGVEVPLQSEFRFFDQADGRFAPTLLLQALDDEADAQILTPIEDSVNVLRPLVPMRGGVAYTLLLQDRFCDDCGEALLRVNAVDGASPPAPAPSITSAQQIAPWTIEPCYSEDALFDGTSETAAWVHVVLDDVPRDDLRLDMVMTFEDPEFGTTREVVGRYPTARTSEGLGGLMQVDNPPERGTGLLSARFVGLDGVPGPASTFEVALSAGVGVGCAAAPTSSPRGSLAALLGVLGAIACRRRRRRGA
jgi:MYXO-CTERM domain-containing protein